MTDRPAHLLRMLVELGELEEKLVKLGSFLFDSNKSAVLDKKQANLMEDQFDSMRSYRSVLKERIGYEETLIARANRKLSNLHDAEDERER